MRQKLYKDATMAKAQKKKARRNSRGSPTPQDEPGQGRRRSLTGRSHEPEVPPKPKAVPSDMVNLVSLA